MRVSIKPDFVRSRAAQQSRTLDQIARTAGIHPSHLYKVLGGSHDLGARKRLSLLAALDAPFEQAFEIVDEARP
jgi:DNA-binding phage protein